MGFKDIIQNAVNVGSETKFIVYVGDEDAIEWSYIQLGTFLVSNASNIESVFIKMDVE